MKQFVTELLQHLRNLLMAATLPDVTRILDLSAEDGERLKKAAGVLSPEELIYFIGKFSDLQSEMKWATNERILLEVELMKLCAPWTEKDLTALAARLGELKKACRLPSRRRHRQKSPSPSADLLHCPRTGRKYRRNGRCCAMTWRMRC